MLLLFVIELNPEFSGLDSYVLTAVSTAGVAAICKEEIFHLDSKVIRRKLSHNATLTEDDREGGLEGREHEDIQMSSQPA